MKLTKDKFLIIICFLLIKTTISSDSSNETGFLSKSQAEIDRTEKYRVTINTFSELQTVDDKSNSHEDSEVVLNDADIEMKIDGMNKKIKYEDFLFMDGLLIIKYSEMTKIQTHFYKKKIDKIKVGLQNIVSEKQNFENQGYIVFRDTRKIPGNYQSDRVFQVVTFYFPDTEPSKKKDSFRLEFWKKYLNKITKQTNLMELQRYETKQQIELQYFDPSIKFNENNPQAKTFYTTIANRGFVLSSDKVASPVDTQHSFRFSQMLSCRPEDPQLSKDKMSEDLASTYQPNDACFGSVVDWNSTPFYDMFCSTYKKSYKYKTDKAILSATFF